MKKEIKKRAGQKEEARELQLGTMIRQRREALGMSQTSLCQGFCTIPNMSRIENNIQLPSRSLVRKLALRLGLPPRQLLSVLDHEDFTIRSLQDEIDRDIIQHRKTPEEGRPQLREQVREKLEKLRRLAEPEDRSIQQFILANEALLGQAEGIYSHEETLAMQLEAIRLTLPAFDLDEIRRGFYTPDESAIMNQIAITYRKMGQRKRAIDIYSQLLRYVEKHDKALPNYGGRFCLIAQNYALTLGWEKHYTDAIEIAEQGLKVALCESDHQFSPSLLSIQAECLFFLGNLEESKDRYFLAYYGFRIQGDKINQEIIRQEIREHFGIEMPG